MGLPRVLRAWVVATALLLPSCTGSPSGPPATAPPTPALSSAEDVARGFLDALGDYDEDRVAANFAEGAMWGDEPAVKRVHWETAWEGAVRTRRLLDSCVEEGASAAGTWVRCTFDLHAFGSDELGRGPFPDNTYRFTIRDGKVVAAEEKQNYLVNGFSDEVWEPFRFWILTSHPEDAPILYNEWPESAWKPPEQDRAIALWQQRIAEWVAEVRARAASAAPAR